jgi:D-arabinose 1-dehydrogenase-like Zn-dependent alcohol dehydrogenase
VCRTDLHIVDGELPLTILFAGAPATAARDTTRFSLMHANEALARLRAGALSGAAVLMP